MDFEAIRGQMVGDVRAYETRSAGDENLHVILRQAV
jgi:hypothetical protein